MIRKLSALAMIAAIGLAVPTPADAQGQGAQSRAQKAQASKAKKAETARQKAALKQNLAQVKGRQKIGKAALKRGLADQKALGRQEASLRKQRLDMKPSVDRAFQNWRADKSPQNKATWDRALAAYKPVRAAHEAALANLRKAQSDVSQLRSFQKNALKTQNVTDAVNASKIKPVPRARPQVAARFVVDLNPTDISVATSGGGLLGGTSAPRRTQAYGRAPNQEGPVANYGPAAFIPQPGATGAQLYTAAGQGQRFQVRQDANYAQPGDPLIF